MTRICPIFFTDNTNNSIVSGLEAPVKVWTQRGKSGTPGVHTPTVIPCAILYFHCISPYFPILPYTSTVVPYTFTVPSCTSLYFPIPPCTSLYFLIPPYTSLYLPVLPYISLYLPIPPCTSLYFHQGETAICDFVI